VDLEIDLASTAGMGIETLLALTAAEDTDTVPATAAAGIETDAEISFDIDSGIETEAALGIGFARSRFVGQ